MISLNWLEFFLLEDLLVFVLALFVYILIKMRDLTESCNNILKGKLVGSWPDVSHLQRVKDLLKASLTFFILFEPKHIRISILIKIVSNGQVSSVISNKNENHI